MARRKKFVPVTPPDWIAETEVKINGRIVTPGTELSIRGERGRMRFIKKVTRPERGVEWIDVADGQGHIRSFRPERVRRVHRIGKTPRALLAARKQLGYDK